MKASMQVYTFRFLGFLLLLLAACTQKRDLSQNTVIVHILAEPSGLHPTNDNNAYQKFIFQSTQKRLMFLDLKEQVLKPDILDEFPEIQSDSLSYRCKIRNGIRWDDGSSMSIEDILFTFKVITCPMVNNPDGKSYFKNLRLIEPVKGSSNEFIIQLNKRYYDNLSMLSFVVVLQKKFHDPQGLLDAYSMSDMLQQTDSLSSSQKIQEFAKNFNASDNGRLPQKLNGLGPYYVSEWNTGSSIILKKKQNWWGKNSVSDYEKAFPEQIIFQVIKDMEPTVLALKKQEVDVSTELSTPALVKLRKRNYFNQNYHSDFLPSFSYTYLGMNMRPAGEQLPYFTDRRVRKALAYCVPVDEIIQVIAKGYGTRIPGFILPAQSDYDKTLPLIPFDLSVSKKLLNEAGWIDSDGDNIRDKLIQGKRVPFSFALSYMLSPVTKEIATMIRNELYKVGIEVRPEPLDFSLFYQKAYKHEFDALLGAWSSSAISEDPRQIWHSENWANNGSNFVGFGNPQSDSLIERANLEMNPIKRKALLQEIQRVVWEEQPYVFLFNATKKAVVHKRFAHGNLYPERPHILLNYLELIPQSKQATPDIP